MTETDHQEGLEYTEPAVERPCRLCGHGETVHEVRDVEGDLKQREFCLECEQWHDFVPEAD